MDDQSRLSRRERQIMDIIYRLGEATATQVRDGMHDPPTRTSVRTLLRILEEKGHLRHGKEGREFVYQPTKERGSAGLSAMRRVLNTFFDGSLEKAFAVHLLDPGVRASPEELRRLEDLIRQAQDASLRKDEQPPRE